MKIMTKLLAGAAGCAAIAAAAPASAQYYPQTYSPYGYSNSYRPATTYNPYTGTYGYATTSPYGYNNQYAYGQAYGMNTAMAQQQCTAAVQGRLANRQSIGGIIGAILGANTSGRVLGVTSVQPRSYGMVRVKGLASSGRYAYNNYSPYGVGAYGALGYNYASAADLQFRCDVDQRGYVRSIDVRRR